MKQAYVQLDGDPVGAGQERVCYLHPDDPSRLVKVQKGTSNTQTRRELKLYRRLARRRMNNFDHIPRFYGEVQTSLGPGFVVDCICDFDGELSKSLWWHFTRGYPISEFQPYLEDLRRYLLDNQVVFSVDMGRYNILFQRLSASEAKLVVIDGLGDHTAINWHDNFAYFARRKIRRRWQRFIGRLHNYSQQTMREHDGAPRQLDAAYRRAGGYMSTTDNELKRFLQAFPDTSHVDVLLIDLCGNAIGKRLPASELPGLYDKGTAVCAAMQLVDAMGNSADPMGYGFSDGDPDAYAVPIPGSLAPIPWLPGNKCQLLCEFADAGSGSPLWFEPRQVLKSVLARFTELGVTPRIALEAEFYLLDPTRAADGGPCPAKSPRTGLTESSGQVLSLDKLDEFEPVLAAIEAACRAQAVPSTSMLSEYGAGQFEVNLQHQDDALQAADHAALLRRVVTGVSRSLGYDASFMSKPFADQSGSGLHLHLSLVDGDGNNLFDPRQPDGESHLRQAVAGLQATMGEAMAIFAPNINVYRRYKPDEFVPVTTDWGDNNRSVAFRIPPSDPANRRVEHRVSGADANPYLVTAAVLAGVHHGLSAGLDPGDMQSGNAGAEVDADLPLTLWQALERIQQATILPEYLGADYLQIYHQVKKAEFEAFMEAIHAREYEWYL